MFARQAGMSNDEGAMRLAWQLEAFGFEKDGVRENEAMDAQQGEPASNNLLAKIGTFDFAFPTTPTSRNLADYTAATTVRTSPLSSSMESRSPSNQYHYDRNYAKRAALSHTSSATSPSAPSSFNSSVDSSSTPATLYSLEEAVETDVERPNLRSPAFQHADLVARLDSQKCERFAPARDNEQFVFGSSFNERCEKGKGMALPPHKIRTVSAPVPRRLPRTITERNPFLGGRHMQSNVRLGYRWSHEMSAQMRNGQRPESFLDLSTPATVSTEPGPSRASSALGIEATERGGGQMYMGGHRSDSAPALVGKEAAVAQAGSEPTSVVPTAANPTAKPIKQKDKKRKKDDQEKNMDEEAEAPERPRKKRVLRWLGLWN